MSNDLVKKENQFVANAEAMDLQEEMQGLNITFDRIKDPGGLLRLDPAFAYAEPPSS